MLIYPPDLIDMSSFNRWQFIQKLLARKKYNQAYLDYTSQWFRHLSDEEVTIVFTNMFLHIKQIFEKKYQTDYSESNVLTTPLEKIDKKLRVTLETALDCDRAKIINKDSVNIFTRINVHFPQMVNKIKETYREEEGRALTHLRSDQRVTELCDSIISSLYIPVLSSYELNRRAILASQSLTSNTTNIPSKTIHAIYPCSQIPLEYQGRMNNILAVCAHLAASEYVTVEDSYFLGEVSKRYIPAMVSQYESFTNDAPETMRKEALQLIVQQLEAIETKLMKISNKFNEHVVDSIKVDAMFLTGATEHNKNMLTIASFKS